MWLRDFELAIIERNTEKIDELISAPMQFENTDEMRRATYLIEEALKLLHELKEQTKKVMVQTNKNIIFLRVTQENIPSKFDIRS